MDKLTANPIGVRMTQEQFDQLHAVASIAGVSAPDLIRQLVDDFLKAKAHEYQILHRAFGRSDFSDFKDCE